MNMDRWIVTMAALVGTGALAQPSFDTNGDGTVSLEEYQAAHAAKVAERFTRLDSDGDGSLSAEELRAGRRHGADEPGRRGMGHGFARLDSDGDGTLSLAELQARHPNADTELFGTIDTDGNGLLTREELRAGRDQMRDRWRKELEAVDTDGDGAWSLAELQAVRPNLTAERFARMDRNGDGLISADERRRRDRD